MQSIKKGHPVDHCLRDDDNLSVLFSQEVIVTPTQDYLPSTEIIP